MNTVLTGDELTTNDVVNYQKDKEIQLALNLKSGSDNQLHSKISNLPDLKESLINKKASSSDQETIFFVKFNEQIDNESSILDTATIQNPILELKKSIQTQSQIEKGLYSLHLNSASMKVKSTKKFGFATECVLFEDPDNQDPFAPSAIPIYQTATFKQPSLSEFGQYDYTRSGNPTRTNLERHLSKIMRANRAFSVSSGMAALDTIIRLVKSGQEIIAGDDIYGGTNRLLTYVSSLHEIKVHHIDTTDIEQVRKRLNEKTGLVLIETPTNPLIKIVDIVKICQWTKEMSPNALVCVDNTMMSPYLQKPLELGADLVYHSGTKYLSGHHDLMAGVIGVKDEIVAEKIAFIVNAVGCGLAPFDCFLLMRGIKTLALRMDKQQLNAHIVAEYLEKKGYKVNYPGLRSHPQYDLHMSQSEGGGAVMSFTTGSIEKSKAIVQATNVFSISVSFGCVNSLISMPALMSHASIPESVRQERQFPDDIIRLCIGIEDAEDLIEDLEQANI